MILLAFKFRRKFCFVVIWSCVKVFNTSDCNPPSWDKMAAVPKHQFCSHFEKRTVGPISMTASSLLCRELHKTANRHLSKLVYNCLGRDFVHIAEKRLKRQITLRLSYISSTIWKTFNVEFRPPNLLVFLGACHKNANKIVVYSRLRQEVPNIIKS